MTKILRNKGRESKSESPRGEGDHEIPTEARKFVDKFPPNEKETEREREREREREKNRIPRGTALFARDFAIGKASRDRCCPVH